jgi:hypothetical protein
MTTDDKSSFTAETSLWQVWKMARRVRRKGFNEVVAGSAALVMLAYVTLSKQTPHDMGEMVRGWADTGLGFSATILGFLVAGFTIFVTVSNRSLLIAMEGVKEKSGLTFLKYNFAVFFETFICYLGFAAVCICVLVSGPSGGLTSQLVSLLPSGIYGVLHPFIPRASAFVMGTWFVLLILELKSFVYNIYHLTMTSIRWDAEHPNGPPSDSSSEPIAEMEEASQGGVGR